MDNIDEYYIKMLDKNNKIIVLCFGLDEILNVIGIYYIDFYFLDVEGVEMVILNLMKFGLEKGKFMVDVWLIEYRVWDGCEIVVEKLKVNLKVF